MFTPTPRFHVHALTLAAAALVLIIMPTAPIMESLVAALTVALSAASLIYAIASFFEPGAHILTKLFSGVAIVTALIAGVLTLVGVDVSYS